MIVIKNGNAQIKTKSRFYSLSVCLNLAGMKHQMGIILTKIVFTFPHFNLQDCFSEENDKIDSKRALTKAACKCWDLSWR